MKKRRISLIILLLLLSAVCLVSLGMAWKEYADRASDRHAFAPYTNLNCSALQLSSEYGYFEKNTFWSC